MRGVLIHIFVLYYVIMIIILVIMSIPALLRKLTMGMVSVPNIFAQKEFELSLLVSNIFFWLD